MIFKKIIGWILFGSGVLIIFWSLYASYNIFTARNKAPEVFKIEEKSSIADSLQKDKTKLFTSGELPDEIKKMIELQMREIIPTEFLAKILNLISWSIFVGILIFGGSKISSLGIRLMKE